MAIQLSKGQRIDLTKTNPGLTKALIGLGWDTNKYTGGADFDLDASINEDSNEELIRYDLGEDFSIETALITGELYRHGGEWKFSAIGSGYQGGLARIATDFGLQVG
ncbi:hypothetical protein DT075_37815 [Bacillus licheniformis]|nr:hypothetical protein DT075_37815 [Bacillus licheniformis]